MRFRFDLRLVIAVITGTLQNCDVPWLGCPLSCFLGPERPFILAAVRSMPTPNGFACSSPACPRPQPKRRPKKRGDLSGCEGFQLRWQRRSFQARETPLTPGWGPVGNVENCWKGKSSQVDADEAGETDITLDCVWKVGLGKASNVPNILGSKPKDVLMMGETTRTSIDFLQVK